MVILYRYNIAKKEVTTIFFLGFANPNFKRMYLNTYF